MMFGLFKRDKRRDVILALYAHCADASRAPWLYAEAGVPDTVEGRLDSLTLHAMLVVRRLGALPEPGPEIAQEMIDVLFQHVDHGLRELGVGDTTVPKRMKKIAQNFYGRVQAYAEPLDKGDDAALGAALERNIPGVATHRMIAYLRGSEARFATFSVEDMLNRADLFEEAIAP
jgi:cytochrome b pre-mRNA-processing protein 3